MAINNVGLDIDKLRDTLILLNSLEYSGELIDNYLLEGRLKGDIFEIFRLAGLESTVRFFKNEATLWDLKKLEPYRIGISRLFMGKTFWPVYDVS